MARLWDFRSRFYDLCEASELRRGPEKDALFHDMQGRTLFVAVGTGLDIRHFPPGLDIAAIDVSPGMLRRAARRAAEYQGRLRLVQMDARQLDFPDSLFDCAVTSCTMCSVPDPVRAFQELFRVLRPGGRLLMFEHVRSRNPIFGLTLDIMTLWTRLGGTDMNRDTMANARVAGFEITRIESVFLDIILAVRARKPSDSPPTTVRRGPAKKATRPCIQSGKSNVTSKPGRRGGVAQR